MKGIVVGTGSIGTRHINNLITLGVDIDAISYRSAHSFSKKYLNKNITIHSINENIDFQKYDFCLVANETNLHLATAVRAVESGCHVFIEKPLSTSKQGLEKLKKISKEKNKIIQVGFMLRYHPNLIFIKKAIENDIIGDVFYARALVGQNLINWRPKTNFKKSYSVDIKKGGGVIFDLCHEFDYLSWILGNFKNIFTLNHNVDFISNEVESISHITFETKNNISGTITLDYVRPFLERSVEIIGSKGILKWDELEGKVKINYKGEFWETLNEVNTGFNRNKMYFNEVEAFLKNIFNNKGYVESNLDQGIVNLNICLLCHLSAKNKKLISI